MTQEVLGLLEAASVPFWPLFPFAHGVEPSGVHSFRFKPWGPARLLPKPCCPVLSFRCWNRGWGAVAWFAGSLATSLSLHSPLLVSSARKQHPLSSTRRSVRSFGIYMLFWATAIPTACLLFTALLVELLTGGIRYVRTNQRTVATRLRLQQQLHRKHTHWEAHQRGVHQNTQKTGKNFCIAPLRFQHLHQLRSFCFCVFYLVLASGGGVAVLFSSV